jgi:hypothetical protein
MCIAWFIAPHFRFTTITHISYHSSRGIACFAGLDPFLRHQARRRLPPATSARIAREEELSTGEMNNYLQSIHYSSIPDFTEENAAMKKPLAILFILVFLLSLGGFPVHAQAVTQRTSFAYVPLIFPGGVISIPIEFRARRAFDALASRLLQAQANGQIVRFEPEFDHALLKVEYRPGFDLAAALSVSPQASPPIFEDPKSVLDYVRVDRVSPAGLVNPAASEPVIFLGVYDSCFFGSNLGPDNYYTVDLLDTNAREVASKFGHIDGSGNLDDCFSMGLWQDMVPGYDFIIKIFDHPGYSLLYTFSTLIPRLNITSITSKTKTFKGIAPANDRVWFKLTHPLLNEGQGMSSTSTSAVTSSKGAWSIKLDSSIAMRGGDQVSIFWPNPNTITNTFIFYRYLLAPFVDCQLVGSYCSVYGIPGKNANITLTHARKKYKISGKSDYYGWFGGYFYDANTDPVFMTAGDKVVGTGAPNSYLPTLSADPTFFADTVSGVAPASRWFEVDLDIFFRDTGWRGDSRWVGSDAGGTYNADFSGSLSLLPSDIIESSVYYVDPATGNETDYWGYLVP